MENKVCSKKVFSILHFLLFLISYRFLIKIKHSNMKISNLKCIIEQTKEMKKLKNEKRN